ncbi:hypothetical protein Y1Q_0022054 [Alligator mississippiensis]|uniref:Uncharacterized protein n=1 Tax=Alligator mississippiensis TaxID=8496 RepID=A0A151NMR5_ALLMI|nr:hypothetical protein Y1Q_0022054 [Alligator mississippiensis]
MQQNLSHCKQKVRQLFENIQHSTVMRKHQQHSLGHHQILLPPLHPGFHFWRETKQLCISFWFLSSLYFS